MNKKILIILLLVASAIGGKLLFGAGGDGADGKKGKDDKPVPVVAAKVIPRMLHDNVEAIGTAFANESLTITANATERLAEIRFTDGQFVHKGDIIAILEQDEEQAELAVAELQLKEHARELGRLKGLLKNKAASQRDVDERQTQVDVAGQQVAGLKARIADRTLTAPFDGVLGIRHLSVGALVQPGDVITTLDDVHEIKLDFSVSATYLNQLSVGMGVEAKSVGLGPRVFSGQVASIDTRVNAATRSVLVRAVLPNSDNTIKPGVLMQVVLLKGERQALVIPEEAVTQRQDNHYVMRIDPQTNTVHEVRVMPGTRRPGILEVVEGLKEGDLIVTRGIEQVKDGGKVEVKEQDKATTEGKPVAEPGKE